MARLMALQMVSTPVPQENLRVLEQHLQQLDISDDTLIVLPECFACFGADDTALLRLAELPGKGEIQQQISQLAGRYGVWLCAGTMPLKSIQPNKFTASCLLFNDKGECLAEYQKIHLFDVQVDDSTGHYQESRFTQPGDRLVVIQNTPFGVMAIAVCYDLRFAGLFQAMGQVDVLAIPAAFTRKTGEAHWHSLLAARSIEKQCYVVAANQGGVHENGRQTYGHSCILSPWGEVLQQINDGPGTVAARMDKAQLASIRQAMPVSQHNQFRSYFVGSR